MKHLSLLMKPASSSCNMRCSYCFYEDVSSLRKVRTHGIMEKETLEQIILNVYRELQDGDHLELAFQGGEPTLAGLDWYRRLVEFVRSQEKRIHVSYSLQTNGILLDNSWAAFFREYQFLIGLSMDSDEANHDENRLDQSGAETWERVRKALLLLRRHEVQVTILTVLTSKLADEPEKVMDHLIREKISSVQFIPCLAPLEGGQADHYALKPEQFAAFYSKIFKLWMTEMRCGNPINIQFLDAVFELLATGRQAMCGLKGWCQLQHVIEADGSMYPCDFHVLDQYCMGSLKGAPLSDIRKSPGAIRFLKERPDPSEFCRSCSFSTTCGGGCRRMRHTMYLNGPENYCGFRDFLESNIKSLHFIARQLV